MSEEERDDCYTFTWRIKNYSCCYQDRGEWITSPTFTLEALCGTRWCLYFYPKGDNSLEENEDFVSCFLVWKICDEVSETPPIDFSLEIVDGEGNVLRNIKDEGRAFSKHHWGIGIEKFLAYDELSEIMTSQKEDILTLRCRIQHNRLKEQSIFGSEASTVIEVDRRFFEWKHVKVPLFPNYSKHASFSLPDFCDFELTLTTLQEGVEISIALKECHFELPAPIMFRLTLCNKRGREIISKYVRHDSQKSETWKFPDFITEDLLKSCNCDSKNYEFELKGEMYISEKNIAFNNIDKLYYKDAMCTCIDAVSKGADILPVTSMQHDFKRLFSNKKYSDVIIHAGNEEFHAHKLVLRVRSPVLEALFAHNLSESETEIVKITDVDEQTMKIFLEFLYTETVEKLDFESAKKLLFAADKYQVPSLINRCASFLQSVLSTENACEIIAAAEAVNCEGLKSYVFDFIVSHDNILLTTGWEELIEANIRLATKILSQLSVDLKRKYK